MTEAFKKLNDLVEQTFLIEDKGVVKLLCASVIANRLPFDPIWLFLVAPSGGGKTEFISALNDVIGIYPLSTVTSKTFISGFRKKGEETSLLFQVNEGIITLKDFTSILSLHKDERQEIMSQLREIYDGRLIKVFGTGEKVDWKGKIGLIAGVTTTIYVVRELYAAMGERFVMYAPVMPNRMKIAERAMQNAATIQTQREELRKAFKHYLDTEIGVPIEYPKPDTFLLTEIIKLAEFSTRARSPVEREWRSAAKEITYVHPPEAPTRFASQLLSLATTLRILNQGNLEDEDRSIIYKIALDSITSTRRLVLREAARYTKINTAGLATKINYPTNSTRRFLEDLNALEVIERLKPEGNRGDIWRLKEEYRKLIQHYDRIEPINRELDEREAEQFLPTELTTELLPEEQSETAPSVSSDDTIDARSLFVSPDDPSHTDADTL